MAATTQAAVSIQSLPPNTSYSDVSLTLTSTDTVLYVGIQITALYLQSITAVECRIQMANQSATTSYIYEGQFVELSSPAVRQSDAGDLNTTAVTSDVFAVVPGTMPMLSTGDWITASVQVTVFVAVYTDVWGEQCFVAPWNETWLATQMTCYPRAESKWNIGRPRSTRTPTATMTEAPTLIPATSTPTVAKATMNSSDTQHSAAVSDDEQEDQLVPAEPGNPAVLVSIVVLSILCVGCLLAGKHVKNRQDIRTHNAVMASLVDHPDLLDVDVRCASWQKR
jgi:hypothetical protein